MGWSLGGREEALIAGLTLYAVVYKDREHRTLARVREYLTLAPRGSPICSPSCRAGQVPLIVEKIRYYDQREFAGLADLW